MVTRIFVHEDAEHIAFDVTSLGTTAYCDLQADEARKLAKELTEAADKLEAYRRELEMPIPGGYKEGDRIVSCVGRKGTVDRGITVFGDRSLYVPVRWDGNGQGLAAGGGMLPKNVSLLYVEQYTRGDRVLVNTNAADLQPSPQCGTVADSMDTSEGWIPIMLDSSDHVTFWLDENVKPLTFD